MVSKHGVFDTVGERARIRVRGAGAREPNKLYLHLIWLGHTLANDMFFVPSEKNWAEKLLGTPSLTHLLYNLLTIVWGSSALKLL